MKHQNKCTLVKLGIKKWIYDNLIHHISYQSDKSSYFFIVIVNTQQLFTTATLTEKSPI